MVSPIPVAVIGAGPAFERLYREQLAREQSLSLAAIVDTDPERRRVAGVPGFGSVEELLATATPAGAIILTPPATHAEIASTLTAAGIAVLVEKPPAQMTSELACFSEEQQARFSVAFSRRFWPTYAELKARSIPEEPIALVLSADPASWGPTIEGGGAAQDLLPHLADIACWIRGGPPTAVRAREVPFGAETCLEWPGAAPILCLTQHKRYAEWARAPRGRVRLGGSTPIAGTLRILTKRPGLTERGIAALLAAWAFALGGEKRTEPAVTVPAFDAAHTSVAVVEAALASLASGGDPVSPARA